MKGFHMLVVLVTCANADDRDCTYALLPPGFDLSDKLLVPQAQVPICTTTTTTSSTTSTSSTITTVTTTSSTSSSGTSTTSSLSTSTVSTFTSTSSSTSQTSSTTTSTTWTRSSSSTTSSTTTSSSSANSTNSVTSTSSTSFEPSTTTSQSTYSSTTTSSTTTTSTTSSTTTSTTTTSSTTTTRSSTSTSTSTSNSTTTSTTTTSTSSTSTSTTSSTSTSVSATSSTSTSVSSTSSTSTVSSSTSSTSTTSSTTTLTSTSTLTTSSTSSSRTSTSTSFTATSSSTSTATLSTSTSTSLSSTSSTASTLTATSTSSTATSSTATSSSVSWTTSTATSVTSTRTSSSTATSTSTSDTTSTTSHTTTSSSTTSSSTTSSSTTSSSTTSTSSSTSSTSSASSSTTSTTSTTRSWCSSFFNGLPPVQDDNCSDLQEGDICEAITFRNVTEDLNDANITDGSHWCYETGPSEFLCGRTGVLLPTSRTIRCQVCAVGSFEDLEDERGKISGSLYWGRNAIDGEIDESLVDGYDIWLVDSCGEQYAHLGQVPKLTVQANECCDPAAYNYSLDVIDLPQEHMSFMITPFQAEDRLLAGLLIPIDERTTTTTTSTASSSTTSTTSSVTTLTSTSTTNTTSTITTWTTSMTTETTSSTLSTTSLSTTSVTSYIPISAVLRGCFGIAVNAPSVFIAMPEAKDAIKEAVANAAGPEVLTTYVQDVLFQQGEACVSRRLSTFRRLQSSLRADYVIVIPATPATESLGGAEAIGGRAKNAIELLSNQQATALLMESLNRFSSLRNFTASVTSIGSVRLQTAVDPLIIPSGGYERVIEAEQKVDNSAAIAALIACTALLLTAVICGTAFLIRRQLKIAAIEESEVYPGALGDEQDTGHMPSAPPTTPIERLTGGLPTSLGPSANESVQDAHPQNECSLPPELSFPELENFNNEDIGTSGPAPCVECSKSAIPCCGRL